MLILLHIFLSLDFESKHVCALDYRNWIYTRSRILLCKNRGTVCTGFFFSVVSTFLVLNLVKLFVLVVLANFIETQELLDIRQRQRGGQEIVAEIGRQANDVISLNSWNPFSASFFASFISV